MTESLPDAPEDEPVIRFDQVGLRFGAGEEVLRDLTFDIPAGAFVAIAGPSGAGKTSLIRLLSLDLMPSRGLIRLFGQDVASLPREERPALRRRIGIVFQDFRLLDHLSVAENVALPLRLAGSEETTGPVSEMLEWVGLADRADAPPAALSGGERQLVAVARAVIARPALILADEPTGSVDQAMSARLARLFAELHREGATVIFATHGRELVAPYADAVIELVDGRLEMDAAAAPTP